MRAITLWAAPLLCLGLSGCIQRVAIQMRYDAQRDQCRSASEKRYGESMGSTDTNGNIAPSDDKNAELASMFSECMDKQGWTVATPAKAGDVATASGNAANGAAVAGAGTGYVAGRALAGRPAPNQQVGSTIASTPAQAPMPYGAPLPSYTTSGATNTPATPGGLSIVPRGAPTVVPQTAPAPSAAARMPAPVYAVQDAPSAAAVSTAPPAGVQSAVDAQLSRSLR